MAAQLRPGQPGAAAHHASLQISLGTIEGIASKKQKYRGQLLSRTLRPDAVFMLVQRR